MLDNCAFVRTSGYLPGPEDVYLSLSMVRKYHLRRGDAVVGQVRQPREGERGEKFNPMVRIDSVNGTEAEGAKERPEFADAVPVHPHQRLRLATDDANLIGRVVDIAAPVGKGQRGLVLTPPRTGATSLLQSIAQSVTTNNPECHVMVVLVDTRPEEVTDYQRAVKGEVVASTFDRQPADHTLVAELAIERAKRLVELGHDVVVLLDSLTRLGRAYNLAAPANGRVLGGRRRRLGGAPDQGVLRRCPQDRGRRVADDPGDRLGRVPGRPPTSSSSRSSRAPPTSSWVLSARPGRQVASLPAVDVAASGTRHEEKLLAPAEELAVVWKLRRLLAALDAQQALELLLGQEAEGHQGQRRVPDAGPEDSPIGAGLRGERKSHGIGHDVREAVAHSCVGSGSRPTHPRGRPGAYREEDTMKKDIHPDYVETAVTCTCGARSPPAALRPPARSTPMCARSATRSTPASRRSSTPVVAWPGSRPATARRPPAETPK